MFVERRRRGEGRKRHACTNISVDAVRACKRVITSRMPCIVLSRIERGCFTCVCVRVCVCLRVCWLGVGGMVVFAKSTGSY